MINVRIVNVIATTSVCQKLNLKDLKNYPDISYDSETYRGMVAYLKTKSMQGKVSIFSSGKLISIGTRSEKQAFSELEYAKDFLIKKGHAKPVETDFVTQNLVVIADFHDSLNLERLSEENRNAIYEPEQFPGAILRLATPFKATVLIFASGKTVITGLKSLAEIEPTIQLLKQIIEPNR